MLKIMGLPENYYHRQALQDIDTEENYYYQRELEEEQAERYEQVYELDLKKMSCHFNIWHLWVKKPTFFDAEFTKYFKTLDEVTDVRVLSDYHLKVQLKPNMNQETSEDFLYCAYDNVRFAIDDNCRENLYTLPF
jgi:hypothetical protein